MRVFKGGAGARVGVCGCQDRRALGIGAQQLCIFPSLSLLAPPPHTHAPPLHAGTLHTHPPTHTSRRHPPPPRPPHPSPPHTRTPLHACRHTIALAERFERGVQSVIAEHRLPWIVKRLGCRVEYWFRPTPPRNGGEAAAAVDGDLDRCVGGGEGGGRVLAGRRRQRGCWQRAPAWHPHLRVAPGSRSPPPPHPLSEGSCTWLPSTEAS